jgi:hypothetical protein
MPAISAKPLPLGFLDVFCSETFWDLLDVF